MPVKLTLASAMGTCFGVQDAIDMALDPSFAGRLTVVGQLVHNPQTVARLLANGVAIVDRDQIDQITTEAVMITAHGASDGTKQTLAAKGFTVYDATCPLVMRLHKLARWLEKKGYFVAVVGKEDHVEVRGVMGNLENAAVVSGPDDLEPLRGHARIGVVSQTTNRLGKVQDTVAAIQEMEGVEEVRFVDTVCQPVKDRQNAIDELLTAGIDLGIVIGGRNSANTAKLRELMLDQDIPAYHIERAEEVDEAWFAGRTHVGITAGTSTPQDVIEAVADRSRSIIAALSGTGSA
jgi:4-hydroxy-3-methylbut-2-enyl diphosphate reductase